MLLYQSKITVSSPTLAPLLGPTGGGFAALGSSFGSSMAAAGTISSAPHATSLKQPLVAFWQGLLNNINILLLLPMMCTTLCGFGSRNPTEADAMLQVDITLSLLADIDFLFCPSL